MEPSEWCVLVHVDIGMRSGLEVVEDGLRELVTGADAATGTIELAALKDERRRNHFEVIGRYDSEAAYREHQVAPSNLAFRTLVGPVLGSPYEDRLHFARGPQRWPTAEVGDFVVVTQIEARPDSLDLALTRFDALVADQSATEGLIGHVALQRHHLPNNLELVSVWTAPETFEESLSSRLEASSAALEDLLLAPIENRRFRLFAGAWTAS